MTDSGTTRAVETDDSKSAHSELDKSTSESGSATEDVQGDRHGGSPEVKQSEVRVVREVAQHRRARRKSRRLTVAMTVSTVVFAVGVGALVFGGWKNTLQITGGTEPKVTDPRSPGYTAAAQTTGSELLLFTNEAGSLEVALLLLGGAGSDHIAVVPISAEMVVWDFEDATPQSIGAVFDDGGADVVALRLGADLTFGIDKVTTSPLAAMQPAFDEVGALDISLPDNVFVYNEAGEREIKYPAGDMTLEPSDFATFLTFVSNNEPELNRSLRVNPVWQKVVDAIHADPKLVNSDDVGDGLALWGVVSGNSGDDSDSATEGSNIVVETLPTIAVPLYSDPPASVSRVEGAMMSSWIAQNVPFPSSAYPGQRLSVSLLNGTGDPDVLKIVSPKVVAAEATIALTGNADSTDLGETQVTYTAPGIEERANVIASKLGVSARRVVLLPSGIDVQISVGKDAL